MKKIGVNDKTLKCGFVTDYIEMMEIANAGFDTVKKLFKKGVTHKELKEYAKRPNIKPHKSPLDFDEELKEKYHEEKELDTAFYMMAEFEHDMYPYLELTLGKNFIKEWLLKEVIKKKSA